MEPYSKNTNNRKPVSNLNKQTGSSESGDPEHQRGPRQRRPAVSQPATGDVGLVPRLLGATLLCGLALTVALRLAQAQEGVASEGQMVAATSFNLSTLLYSLMAVLGLTLLSGAFSMAETALASLRRSRVEQLLSDGRRGASTVQRLVNDPPRYVATVQTGITVLGFAAAAIAATNLADGLVPLLAAMGVGEVAARPLCVGIVILLVALLVLVLGEIAPKSLAQQAPEFWALRLAPFIHFCSFLFAPLTGLVLGLSNLLVRPFGAKARFESPLITRQDVEHLIDEGEQQGEIDDEEAKIITNVFDLSETPVRSVMTPRIDMTAIAVDSSIERILQLILESGHSRIPVYQNSIDNVVGIVHAKDLLPYLHSKGTEVVLREVMREPYYVPETKKVSELLNEMRRDKQQLAIVQDEYAGTEGIVTIEDLLEEIVGEIRDEYDVDEPEIQIISEDEAMIDGRMAIADVNDRLGLELPHKEYHTLGGMVFGLLGHEPVPGERVAVDGMEFQVERIEGRSIRQIRAVRLSPAYEELAGVTEGE